MNLSKIHPTAIVEPGAKIGTNVTIEPYAVIKGTVIIENDVVIKSHAYIDGNTTIGEGTIIYPSASIGTKTQDLKFRGKKRTSRLENIVRYANLSRSIPRAKKDPLLK